jgi:hypothetical protein
MSDSTRPGGPAQARDTSDTKGRQEGGVAKSSAAELASEARGAVRRVGDEAAAVVQDVKAEGAAVVDAAQERATGFAEEQKEAGAEQADSLARAVHRAADELQGTSPQIARYVHEAASSVDHLGRALRERSPGELIIGVEDLARRQPVAFFGAAVLAGFALARFAKSSAQDARPPTHNAGSAHGTRPAQSQSPRSANPAVRRPSVAARQRRDPRPWARRAGCPTLTARGTRRARGLPPWPPRRSAVRRRGKPRPIEPGPAGRTAEEKWQCLPTSTGRQTLTRLIHAST